MSQTARGGQPMSADQLPSSFDDSDFFEEGRAQKLWRKLKQEPLIPLGCLATCFALYQATKSIRNGDKNQTNKMFRMRVYAQGFTLLAVVAGSMFYQDERMKRKAFEGKVEEKKAAEKRDKWLRELEARDEEDKAWRARITSATQKAGELQVNTQEVVDEAQMFVKEKSKAAKKAIEARFPSKSVREEVIGQGWGPGTWLSRTRESWNRL